MYYQHTEHSAEGEAENSQAKGPDTDDTLESIAPKKPNLSGPRTERMNIFCSCAFIVYDCNGPDNFMKEVVIMGNRKQHGEVFVKKHLLLTTLHR